MAQKKKSVKKRTKKTKPSVAKQSKEKVFYVNIEEPVDKQRLLLEITADYLRMLKNIAQLKSVRERKKALLADFQKQMSQIRSDASKLYQLLPKYNIPHRLEKPKVVSEQKPTDKVVKKPVRHANTEIEALEAELAEIESRLAGQ